MSFYGHEGEPDPRFVEMFSHLQAFAESVHDCIVSQISLSPEDEQIVKELIESANAPNT